MEIREIREKLDQAEKILVGLGGEWQMQPPAGSFAHRPQVLNRRTISGSAGA